MAKNGIVTDFLDNNAKHPLAQPIQRINNNGHSQESTDKEAIALKTRRKEAALKYGRGREIAVKSIRDKKLRGNLATLEKKNRDAIIKARDAEVLHENEPGFLLPEGDLEKTHRVRQSDIKENVDIQTAKKGLDLKLDEFGPYMIDYTKDGRYLLLSGRKGHIATMDWRDGKIGCELTLGETVRDAKWLHNNQYFAAAQKRDVYIYDHAGVELHKLKNDIEVKFMEFLPYHFLLAKIGMAGYLKYTDTTTGQMITQIHTKQGTPTSFGQNPWNGIILSGHKNGQVRLWSPNSPSPRGVFLAHRAHVSSLSVDREGRYMVTTGLNSRMAVWDIRNIKAGEPVHEYFLKRPGSSVAISDQGLTGVGWGTQVTIWKGLFNKAKEDQEKVQQPYMSWGGEGKQIEKVRWCPLDDILGISHDKGFSSIIVPGAGEPNFDSLEVNPYQNSKQRQEAEIKMLLNKLPPETIDLDSNFIGNIDSVATKSGDKEKDPDQPPEEMISKLKNRGRGRNSALRRYRRKLGSKNVIDERRLRLEAILNEQEKKSKQTKQDDKKKFGPALARFARKAG